MSDILLNRAANLQELLTSAASIGAEYGRESAVLTADEKKADGKTKEAQEAAKLLRRANSKLNRPIFRAGAEVAKVWARLYGNDLDSQDSRAATISAVKSLLDSFSGATDKTDAGGRAKGLEHFVALGSNAERLRREVQKRIDFWQDSADQPMTPQTAASIADAKAHLNRAATTPNADGSLKTDKNGKVIVPASNGRPERAFPHLGLVVPAAGASPIDSVLAEFARMYSMHGDKMLASEVIDAMLFNGGKYQHDSDTVASHAAKAVEALDALLRLGGASSADAAILTLASSMVARIEAEGFKASAVAPAQPIAESAPAPVTQAEPESTPAPVDAVDALLAQPITPPSPVSARAAKAAAKAARQGGTLN